MKEIKANESSRQRVGYSSPSVRIINLGLKHSVLLSVSTNEFNTNPGEMGGDGGNVF